MGRCDLPHLRLSHKDSAGEQIVNEPAHSLRSQACSKWFVSLFCRNKVVTCLWVKRLNMRVEYLLYERMHVPRLSGYSSVIHRMVSSEEGNGKMMNFLVPSLLRT